MKNNNNNNNNNNITQKSMSKHKVAFFLCVLNPLTRNATCSKL